MGKYFTYIIQNPLIEMYLTIVKYIVDVKSLCEFSREVSQVGKLRINNSFQAKILVSGLNF
jgi:hypothetical protein